MNYAKLWSKAKEIANERKPFVARHPKTGLWHGIDRVLRCPITEGYSDRKKAESAWRDYVAREIACTVDSKRGIAAI